MQKLIKGLAIAAGVWSAFPWALAAVLCLLGALLPDPGSIISFKVPWWAVLMVWGAEPLLWYLLWQAQKRWEMTLALTVFLSVCFGGALCKDAVGLMVIWLGPSAILLPCLFYWHRHAKFV